MSDVIGQKRASADLQVKVAERSGQMNIPELSTALSNVNMMNQVGIAVLDKALENSEATGESLINMMDRSMELSVNPAVGGNFDMYV